MSSVEDRSLLLPGTVASSAAPRFQDRHPQVQRTIRTTKEILRTKYVEAATGVGYYVNFEYVQNVGKGTVYIFPELYYEQQSMDWALTGWPAQWQQTNWGLTALEVQGASTRVCDVEISMEDIPGENETEVVKIKNFSDGSLPEAEIEMPLHVWAAIGEDLLAAQPFANSDIKELQEFFLQQERAEQHHLVQQIDEAVTPLTNSLLGPRNR